MTEILRVLVLDQHLCQTHCIRNAHKFLAEQAHVSCRVVVLNVVVCRRKHTTSTAGLIADSNNLAVVKDIVTTFRHQDLNQQFDNISAGIKLTSIYILEETSDQVFKDVAHFDAVKGFEAKVQFRESFNHRI